MEVQDFIRQVHITLTGKGGDEAPREGSEEWQRYIDIGNQKLYEWAHDPREQWESLYRNETESVGKGDEEVDISRQTIHVVGDITLRHVNGVIHIPQVASRELLQARQLSFCIEGATERIIRFSEPLPEAGEIYFGVYAAPKDIGRAKRITVDNHRWLVLATAAELSRNDPVKDEQFANLMGMANDIYEAMKQQNRRNRMLGVRRIKHEHVRIGGI